MVSARKWFFLSFHGTFLMENTLSVAACVLGSTKDNSKICKFVVKCLHITRT
jgi:hypothetical protein